MKFKILKGTDLFKQLIEFNAKLESVREAARNLAKELGGGDVFTSSFDDTLAGGIDAIKFKEKPEGWKRKGESWQHIYYPTAALLKKDKELARKLKELPVVSSEELNEIVGYKGNQVASASNGLAWVKTVGIAFGEDVIIMQTHTGTEYTPHPDAIEILESEFEKLENAIKEKENVEESEWKSVAE